MSDHHYGTAIVSCIDFRFQDYITDWIEEHYPDKTYDRIALAGGVYDFEIILKQIQISQGLHTEPQEQGLYRPLHQFR